MLFGLWTRMGPRNHVLDVGPQLLRDVAMATNFWLSMGYNFGCVIVATHCLIPGVGFWNQAIWWRHSRDRCITVTAMATNFGTEIAITAFVWTIATRQLVMEGVWVVGQQNADIVDTLQLRDVAMATIFLSIYRVYVGDTCWLQLNHPCAAAMRPCVKLLWPLVILSQPPSRETPSWCKQQ